MKNTPTFEDFNNSLNEKLSMDAVKIHTILSTGQDAAQHFIDDNNLDGKKLADYVIQHKNSVEKYAVRDMISGKIPNPKLMKMFVKESEEVNEGIFYRLPKDVISNDLYLTSRNLTNFYDRAAAGNDVEPGVLDSVIKNLSNVKKAVKRFNSKEEVIGSVYESEVNEDMGLDLSKWKIGDTVEFENGEVWKVAKPGYKKSSDTIFLAPFNDIAKKGHISLAIEFNKSELENRVQESTNVNEASVQVAGHGKPAGAQVLATVIMKYLEDNLLIPANANKKAITAELAKLIMDSTF